MMSNICEGAFFPYLFGDFGKQKERRKRIVFFFFFSKKLYLPCRGCRCWFCILYNSQYWLILSFIKFYHFVLLNTQKSVYDWLNMHDVTFKFVQLVK